MYDDGRGEKLRNGTTIQKEVGSLLLPLSQLSQHSPDDEVVVVGLSRRCRGTSSDPPTWCLVANCIHH